MSEKLLNGEATTKEGLCPFHATPWWQRPPGPSLSTVFEKQVSPWSGKKCAMGTAYGLRYF